MINVGEGLFQSTAELTERHLQTQNPDLVCPPSLSQQESFVTLLKTSLGLPTSLLIEELYFISQRSNHTAEKKSLKAVFTCLLFQNGWWTGWYLVLLQNLASRKGEHCSSTPSPGLPIIMWISFFSITVLGSPRWHLGLKHAHQGKEG